MTETDNPHKKSQKVLLTEVRATELVEFGAVVRLESVDDRFHILGLLPGCDQKGIRCVDDHDIIESNDCNQPVIATDVAIRDIGQFDVPESDVAVAVLVRDLPQ